MRSRWYGAGGIAGLSKVSGVSRATMYSWFRGETAPDTKSLSRLASVLDISTAELVDAIGAEAGAPIDQAPPVTGAIEEPRMMMRMASSPMQAEAPPRMRSAPRTGGPMIGEVLPSQHVMVCDADDRIGPVAKALYERHFSQVPVRDGGHWMGLLTTEAIARWMAGRSRNELDVEARAPVREVLAYADDAGDFRVVPPDMPVADVVAFFDGAALRGQPLQAVLVASPRAAIAPQGIVTVYDLPHLRRQARIPTANLSQPTDRLTREPDERGRP